MGQGHQLLRLVAGVSEHDTLISRTNFLDLLVDVDSLSDIRALVLDCDNDVALAVVKTLRVRIVTDITDRITHYLFPVDFGSGCDLSEDHHHLPLSRCFAGNFRIGVLGQAGVKDGIGDLVAQLVYAMTHAIELTTWMSLVHRLRRKQKVTYRQRFHV